MGASKSSGTTKSPLPVPSGRGARFGLMATSRATGLPDLAMITSSPACTRCSNLEKWVLASWMLTSMVPILD